MLQIIGVEMLCCYITALDAEQTGRNTDWVKIVWGNRT